MLNPTKNPTVPYTEELKQFGAAWTAFKKNLVPMSVPFEYVLPFLKAFELELLGTTKPTSSTTTLKAFLRRDVDDPETAISTWVQRLTRIRTLESELQYLACKTLMVKRIPTDKAENQYRCWVHFIWCFLNKLEDVIKKSPDPLDLSTESFVDLEIEGHEPIDYLWLKNLPINDFERYLLLSMYNTDVRDRNLLAPICSLAPKTLRKELKTLWLKLKQTSN